MSKKFIMEMDDNTRKHLEVIAKVDGVSMSDEIRLLINGEYIYFKEHGSWRTSKRK